MTSRGQCPRVVVLVNVFTPPPPSGNPVSAPGAHEFAAPGPALALDATARGLRVEATMAHDQ